MSYGVSTPDLDDSLIFLEFLSGLQKVFMVQDSSKALEFQITSLFRLQLLCIRGQIPRDHEFNISIRSLSHILFFFLLW